MKKTPKESVKETKGVFSYFAADAFCSARTTAATAATADNT
jgi:hypothetical protein